MSFIVLSIIVGVVVLGIVVALVFSTQRAAAAGLLALVLVAYGVLTLIMSMTTVDARAVAIQQSFGRYNNTLGPGLQLIAPWSSTEEFTTRLQPADLDGKGEGVPVTFKGGGSGTVNSTFQWSINDSRNTGTGAKALWEKYKDFDTVRDNLVMKQARDVILNVTNDYTPNDARTKQDVIADQVKSTLNQRLARYGVTVDTVSIVSMPLDARTQASLDKIVEAQNNIERSEAERTRAKIDADTVDIRNKTGALSPQANQRFCLDVVNNWDVNKNGALPATFDCSLGNSDKNVLVGAGK